MLILDGSNPALVGRWLIPVVVRFILARQMIVLRNFDLISVCPSFGQRKSPRQ